MSKDFLLIQKVEDFFLNGYCIIRKDHFDAIRCNKFDKAFKRILKAEGVFDTDYGIKNRISLKDWKTIFEDLVKQDYHVIVECEDQERPTKVKYIDITRVRFDDKYINVFKKYLRKN